MLHYDYTKAQIIPYVKDKIQYGNKNDFLVVEDVELALEDADYDNTTGNITLISENKEGKVTTQEEMTICKIRFKLIGTGTVLEQDIADDIFVAKTLDLLDGDGNAYEAVDLVKINTMRKIVDTISVSDIVFDKNLYQDGEQIKLDSGTMNVTYTNASSTAGQTSTIDLATLKDGNGNDIAGIQKGPWTADYDNPNVGITYKEETVTVPVNVADTIDTVELNKPSKVLYNYGDEVIDLAGATVKIKLKSQTTGTEKSLLDLISEGKASIRGFNSKAGPKQTITQTINVSLNFPEYNFTKNDLSFDITIVDPVQGIEWITEPTKKTYEYKKDALNVTGGKIKVTYLSTQTDEINLTEDTINVKEIDGSNFNNTNIGTRDLKVTYNYTENGVSKSKELNYGITVYDVVENVTITPGETEYLYGDTSIDLAGAKVQIKLASKTDAIEKSLQELIDDGKASIRGFDSKAGPKQTITQTINVSLNFPEYNYTKNDLSFDITIVDPVQGIEWIKEPTKKTYEYKKDALNVTGGKIKVTYLSTQTDEVELTSNKVMVTEDDTNNSSFDNTAIGTRNLKVIYNYTENGVSKSKELKYEITVYDVVENVTITPGTTEYLYGATSIDLSGAKVQIKLASKTDAIEKSLQELIDDDKASVRGFNSTAGPKQTIRQTINVSLNLPEYNFTKDDLSFEVTIVDPVQGIAWITKPTKNTYKYNEDALDVTGGKIKVTYLSTQTDEVNLTEDTINVKEIDGSNFNNTNIGTRNLKVIYNYTENGVSKSKELNYEITVYIETIELNKTTMTIPYGHIITNADLQEYKIIVTRKTTMARTSTIEQQISITSDMIEYDRYTLGTQTAYVVYKYVESGKEVIKRLSLSITVENYISHIELTKDNITLKYEQDLDENTLTEDYKIIVVWADGTEEKPVRLTKDKIVGIYNTQKEGAYKVQVEHNNKTADFTINVIDEILEIKLEDEEKEKIKTEYKYKEELELNGAKLTIVKMSGETKIDLTKDMIKNYNSEEIAKQLLNIEYENKKLEEVFEVEVQDYIVDIILVKPTKVSYLPGETLDLTGATVQTVYASGKVGEPVAVTLEMISGYNSNEMGTQIITINYEGFQKSFEVIFTVQTGIEGNNIYDIWIMAIEIIFIGIFVLVIMEKRKRINSKK